jgi:hypothetical protein
VDKWVEGFIIKLLLYFKVVPAREACGTPLHRPSLYRIPVWNFFIGSGRLYTKILNSLIRCSGLLKFQDLLNPFKFTPQLSSGKCFKIQLVWKKKKPSKNKKGF